MEGKHNLQNNIKHLILNNVRRVFGMVLSLLGFWIQCLSSQKNEKYLKGSNVLDSGEERSASPCFGVPCVLKKV